MPAQPTTRRRTRSGSPEGRGVLIASRIHMPEAAAASFRLQAVEEALAARGVPVLVLTSRPPKRSGGGGARSGKERAARVSRWPVLRDKSGYLRGYLPYISFDLPLFGRLLAAGRPRIALIEPPPTTGVVARIALGLRRIPYVWYAPDIWSDAAESTNAPGLVKRAVRRMESFALSGARSVIAINEEVAARARDLGGADVRVVPNGIDTSVFTEEGPGPGEAGLAAAGVAGPYFLYAGTASEWQGADVFVDALKILRRSRPGVQLVFLGQGSAWPMLREEAARIPRGADGREAVVFIPALPPEEAAAWQRGALASLVSIRPGLGYDFAYPTKVLAALACGCPVLYAGAGGAVADIRANALGRAVAHDPAAVAEAMARALDDGEAGRWSDAEKARLHRWVEENRSIRATGEKAAAILLEGL